jgi:hypothetical protein
VWGAQQRKLARRFKIKAGGGRPQAGDKGKGQMEGHSQTMSQTAEKKLADHSDCRTKRAPRGPSSSLRRRHSKAMGTPRQHARREVRIGIRLPTNHESSLVLLSSKAKRQARPLLSKNAWAGFRLLRGFKPARKESSMSEDHLVEPPPSTVI